MRNIIPVVAIAAMLSACVSADDPNRRTKQGAAAGAAAGAVAGAVIGNQSGNPRTGAVVGAAVGAGVGAVVGRRMDKQAEELRRIEGIEVERTAEDEIDVRLRNDVLFDFDSAALRAESRDTLDELADVMSRYPEQTVVVEGHADSVGDDAYNQRLSERRAQSVADYLIRQGVPGSDVEWRGFGETEPRASNSTAEGRQLNRRVEISITAHPES